MSRRRDVKGQGRTREWKREDKGEEIMATIMVTVDSEQERRNVV